jgi:hypothetical protein
MIISHKYKFIFIKTRKTAGTSIETYLSQHCGDMDIVTPVYPEVDGHIPRNEDGFYNHITAENVRQNIDDGIWDNYYKFCVERNPWDKTLSYYSMLNFRSAGQLSLEDYFILNDYCVDYSSYTSSEDSSRILVDEVIKYENLNQSLNDIFKSLGVPFDGSLGVNAKSEYRKDKRPYKDVLTVKQAEIIAKKFANELSLFGYEY